MARRPPDCYLDTVNEPRPVDGWLWKPRRPANLFRISHPTAMVDASADPFCSGHTFLPDGDLLVTGGLNLKVQSCGGCGTGQSGPGHLWTYRMDTSCDPPEWDPSWLLTKQMGRARWYPTAISMDDGDVLIGGHGPNVEPGNLCPPIYSENPSNPSQPYNVLYDKTYETLDWATTAFGSVVTSYVDTFACGFEDQSALARLLAYPRLHLLSNRNLFHTDAVMTIGYEARVMDVDPATILCGDGRWLSQTSLPQITRNGGGTVHLIFRDQDSNPTDVVYAIGGTDGSDEDLNPGGAVHDSVEKATLGDSDPTLWQWVGGGGPGNGLPPDLNTRRFNHNSVILLDGSILVNGGWVGEGDTSESGLILNTERYRPPELFAITEGSGLDTWKEMTTAVEPSHRRYHSVAGLLADGRMFSAGGNEAGQVTSAHTVNIYSPSYFFYPRPEITSAPVSTKNQDLGGTNFFVNVSLSSSTATFSRVGLVRNGSVTHAWDMNQRYVELEVVNVFPQGGSDFMLEVAPPEDGFVAPPGYYILSVVEENTVPPPPPPAAFYLEQRWIPSPGVWFRIEDV
jgi:hypothetical protein